VPSKKPSRLHVGIDSYTSGTNQQFVGPGATGGVEVPSFKSGGPLAPSVPYDFFSGAPTTTGQAIAQDLIITPTYRLFSNLDIAVSAGYGSIGGSGNVGAYWGDSLMPTINPHLGSLAAQITPDFPTHNGGDSINASRFSVLDGTIALHDGSGALTGGWFDQHQLVPFVFAQAPWTNTPFQLAPQIPGSIGDGPPTLDVLKQTDDVLPLQGYDLWAKTNAFTFEASNANLPAMAGTVARESTLSGIYAAGQIKISAEIAHLMQSGPISGRFSFGGAPSTTALDGSAEVPFSTLTGQRMAIEGIGASFPLATADAELRYAHSCYAADNVAIPTAGCTSGNYYYVKLHQGFSKFDLVIDAVRFEPQYAPAVLSYGTIENVWSAPFSINTNFLKGDYQFVDNSEVGPNRQGIRAATTFLIGGVETRIAFGHYQQVTPYDLTDGTQVGYIEPYFSPQTSAQGVRGYENHASAWFGWHPKIADVSLELSDVTTARGAPAGSPQDGIAIDYPSAVVSVSRLFGRLLGGVGAGRYAVQGSWDTVGTINASLSQDVVFAGLEYRANANSAYALQYSVFSVNGTPIVPAGFSPAYHGPQLQFYQRLKT